MLSDRILSLAIADGHSLISVFVKSAIPLGTHDGLVGFLMDLWAELGYPFPLGSGLTGDTHELSLVIDYCVSELYAFRFERVLFWFTRLVPLHI